MREQAIAWLKARQPTRRVLQWWDHWRTDVYVVSYPKCGRTWLRFMMGKALDEQYRLGAANPMAIGSMHHMHPSIPRIRLTHELAHRTDASEPKQRYRDKVVVLLVRDPRDVVVSMYFEATKRRDLFSGDLSAFVRSPVGGLDAIIRYYNAWAEARDIPRRFCTVSYEDLHREPVTAIAGVFETLRVPVEHSVLEQAVAQGSFDKMRELERRDAFGDARLRPANKADPESFKTRKGQIGGYREYLKGDDLEYVEERIASSLSPYFAAYRRG